ncbi:MAG: serine/threonine-protein kinase, partial [Pseudomonadota bacterium]
MSARRYWVLEVLGRGGFGSVYRAELQGQGGFRKSVAIKMLNPDRAGSPEILRRLRDEARLLARISHPGIVQVDGLVRLGGHWAVVMEHVPGVSLAELVTLGPVPILCAVQLAARVGDALDAAHNAEDEGLPLQLVHRDIKPSNLLLTTDGSVKLLDFGVAQANPAAREANTDELFFGAPEYMAPERWQFLDTPAADVYSLGVVLYELLVGEHLGRTSADREAHGALVGDAVARLSLANNAELSALVTAALAFDADARPSAREFTRRCEALVPELPGPWLRDWAEREVTRARSRRPVIDADPLLDVILSEDDEDDVEVTAYVPEVPEAPTVRMRLLVLASVALLAGLTWWAVTAADDLRRADQRSSGVVRVQSPPPLAALPAAAQSPVPPPVVAEAPVEAAPSPPRV